MINVSLLKEIKTTVQKNRERHNQGAWRLATDLETADEVCGTSMCTAGWAAELSGATWFLSPKDLVALFEKAEQDYDYDGYPYDPSDFEPDYIDYVVATDDDDEFDIIERTHPITGKRCRIINAEQRGQRVLGLSDPDKDHLFYVGSEGWDEVMDSFIEQGEREAEEAKA